MGKSEQLEKYGIKVLRFSNDQIYSDVTSVISQIQKKITKYTPLQGGRGACPADRSRLSSGLH